MCGRVPSGWYLKKLHLNSEGPHQFGERLCRTLHVTVGGVMDLSRLLDICLSNQGFIVPIFTLHHFPNGVFFFQINKLSVLFNVL